MNKTVPWNVKGVDFDTREAARRAARKAGVPVGEWLDEVIAERAAEAAVQADDMSATDRLESLAARLADLAESRPGRDNPDAQRRRNSSPVAQRPSSRSEVARGRADQPVDDEMASANEAFVVEDEHFGSSRSVGPRSDTRSVKRSLRPSQDRRSTREPPMADDYDDDGDAPNRRVTRSQAADHDSPLRQALGSMAARLNDLETRVSGSDRIHDSSPRSGDRSTRREQDPEARSRFSTPRSSFAGYEPRAEIEQIDGKLAAILDRLNRKSRSDVPAAPSAPEPVQPSRPRNEGRSRAGLLNMQDALADIARRQADLERAPVSRSTLLNETSYASIGRAQREGDAPLRAQVTEVPPTSPTALVVGDTAHASLDDAFRALSARLEDRIERAAKSRAAEEVAQADFARLQAQVTQLGGRVESLRTAPVDEAEQARSTKSYEALREEIAQLARGCAELAKQPSVASLEEAVRNLAGRIELSRLDGIEAKVLAPVEKLGAELRAAIETLSPRDHLDTVEHRLASVVTTIEAMDRRMADQTALTALEQRTDELRVALTEAAKAPPFVQRIENELDRLGERVERLAASPAGVGTAELDRAVAEIRSLVESSAPEAFFDRLDRKMDDLASRLDDTGQRAAQSAAFEQLARQIDETHASLAARVAARADQVDLRPVEQMFDEVSRKIDGLQGTSDEMRTLDKLVRGLMLQIEEVRQPLEDAASSRALETKLESLAVRLDRKMDELATRLGEGDRHQADASLFDDLSRQIERAHDSLAARLGGRSSSTVPDLQPLQSLLGEVSSKIEQQQDASNEVRTLDGLIRELMLQIDDARHPAADRKTLDSLESHLARVAERLDKSDASLGAIASLERAMGDLFQQLEDTRTVAIDAAENAARTAAQDTLRAAMNSPSLNGKDVRAQAGLVAEQVSQELSEFRRAQDASERRVHGTLKALSETLERLVDRMVDDLQATSRPGVERRSDMVSNPQDAKPTTSGRSLPPASTLGAPADAGVRSVAEDARDRDADSEFDRPLAEAADAEPPVRRLAPSIDIGRPPGMDAGPEVSPLIAAARRAAQAAQASAAAAARPKVEPMRERTVSVDEPAGRSFFAQKRRPLLLGLAGVVLLLGALQVVKLTSGFHSGTANPEAPAAQGEKSDTKSELSPTAPANEQASTPAATPASPATTADAPAVSPPKVSEAATPVTAADPAIAGLPAGLRDLAMRGDAAAQYEVAVRLADGRGVTRDLKDATVWFERAAKQGLAPAQYRLGSMYEKGLGVSADPVAAVTWYEKAANAGNTRAMHNLAVLSAEGSKPDYAKAVTWFTKAANAGIRDSQYNLAILYARGLGVPQNLAQSYSWFAVAAAQGDADAARKRDDIAAKLDAKTLGDVKAASDAFKPTTADRAANEVKAPPGGWDALAPPNNAARDTKLRANQT